MTSTLYVVDFTGSRTCTSKSELIVPDNWSHPPFDFDAQPPEAS